MKIQKKFGEVNFVLKYLWRTKFNYLLKCYQERWRE